MHSGVSTPLQNKGISRAVYFNRRQAIGGLGRSPKEIILVQRPPAKQACPAKLGTIQWAPY